MDHGTININISDYFPVFITRTRIGVRAVKVNSEVDPIGRTTRGNSNQTCWKGDGMISTQKAILMKHGSI